MSSSGSKSATLSGCRTSIPRRLATSFAGGGGARGPPPPRRGGGGRREGAAGLDGHALVPLDRDHDPLEREAALVVADPFIRALDEPRVDEHLGVLLRIRPKEEDPPENSELGRGEPEPVRVDEQVLQLLDEPRQVRVEGLDLVGLHPQGGVGVLADLGKRDSPPRLGLGIQLFLSYLASVAHAAARSLGQRLWGSTSTTAVRPARRIAGAADASNRAVRAARRRGSSVFATSWARCLPRSRKSGAGPSRSPPSPARSSSSSFSPEASDGEG